MVFTDLSNNKDPFLHSYVYHQVPNNIIENFQLMPSIDIQRRNVIMPRICYFSRVTQAGIHQKLCLPYNNES